LAQSQRQIKRRSKPTRRRIIKRRTELKVIQGGITTPKESTPFIKPEPHVLRTYPLKPHPVQKQWINDYRFNIVPAGRRSGKTEIWGKRKLIHKALIGSPYPGGGRYFAGAPTRDQAKRIYWKDLKLMTPKHLMAREPAETELTIYLVNGSEIHVLGMDKPERVEGTPWDHGVLDEIGNMKESTWPEHVRPALSDRIGTCDFIGVPEGRNHYYDLYSDALADETGTWKIYHWFSSDILPPEEIKQAKRDLDELTFQQEYEGSFISFTGRAYYNFDSMIHSGSYKQYYRKHRPLIFTFDFNESPGVANIIQEFKRSDIIGKTLTGIIGEVYIPQNSNTNRVCDKLIEDWGEHEGEIYCYGDATGGSKGSAKVKGSDWDLVKQKLWKHFGNRVKFRVPKANPRERVRVNSMNSRLLNVYEEVFMVVDHTCKYTIKDFEGVRVIEGGTGEIDKKRDPKLSHLTDGIGYYIAKEYPILEWEPTKQKFWK
jgi:hypothetical protein